MDDPSAVSDLDFSSEDNLVSREAVPVRRSPRTAKGSAAVRGRERSRNDKIIPATVDDVLITASSLRSASGTPKKKDWRRQRSPSVEMKGNKPPHPSIGFIYLESEEEEDEDTPAVIVTRRSQAQGAPPRTSTQMVKSALATCPKRASVDHRDPETVSSDDAEKEAATKSSRLRSGGATNRRRLSASSSHRACSAERRQDNGTASSASLDSSEVGTGSRLRKRANVKAPSVSLSVSGKSSAAGRKSTSSAKRKGPRACTTRGRGRAAKTTIYRSNSPNRTPSPEVDPPTPADGAYHVRRIVGYDEKTNRMLVHWAGYGHSQNTWEPVQGLKNSCPEMSEYLYTIGKMLQFKGKNITVCEDPDQAMDTTTSTGRRESVSSAASSRMSVVQQKKPRTPSPEISEFPTCFKRQKVDIALERDESPKASRGCRRSSHSSERRSTCRSPGPSSSSTSGTLPTDKPASPALDAPDTPPSSVALMDTSVVIDHDEVADEPDEPFIPERRANISLGFSLSPSPEPEAAPARESMIVSEHEHPGLPAVSDSQPSIVEDMVEQPSSLARATETAALENVRPTFRANDKPSTSSALPTGFIQLSGDTIVKLNLKQLAIYSETMTDDDEKIETLKTAESEVAMADDFHGKLPISCEDEHSSGEEEADMNSEANSVIEGVEVPVSDELETEPEPEDTLQVEILSHSEPTRHCAPTDWLFHVNMRRGAAETDETITTTSISFGDCMKLDAKKLLAYLRTQLAIVQQRKDAADQEMNRFRVAIDVMALLCRDTEGYLVVQRMVTMTPDQVVEELKKPGLRVILARLFREKTAAKAALNCKKALPV
ncbi:hypothetical protein BV898_06899 [Hypsibius exemplaris]|uniref:Chromo domain-containing protein n=1 Tax=Hypsibius exemplaris TaxID=2072580 RepID=A0A1W0WV23_HYPEX|nr:hypothetical protein BV898_06899 [Hypsibius exemplaris]